LAKSYILPFFLYLLGVGVVTALPSGIYPVAYSAVVVLVAVVTLVLLRGRRIVAPHWRVGEAVVVGLVGIVLWVGLSQLRLEDGLAAHLPSWLRPQPRAAYNPFEQLTGPLAIWGFVAVRLIGLVLLVPLAEELFWRGFLLRWLTSAEWEQVPLGRFSVKSFLGVTLLCTLAHPEWLAAAVYCALLNGLFYWKKDLWSCIVAHGVSNLLLGLYVLLTGAWWLW
jgi:uncharacterized protein